MAARSLATFLVRWQTCTSDLREWMGDGRHPGCSFRGMPVDVADLSLIASGPIVRRGMALEEPGPHS
jgi:hypothetical protein